MRYFSGTSGAAAIVTHLGALLLEELANARDWLGDPIDDQYWAVLTKALLVHSSALPESSDEIKALFPGLDPDKVKDAITRFYGYGVLDPDLLLDGSPTRATVMGWGALKDGEALRFELPLPPSLSAKAILRRLIVSMAYIAPIRVRDRRHRAAMLFITPDQEMLNLRRQEADWRTVRRGTMQHERFESENAAAFVDGDNLFVQVNCRKTVQGQVDDVPFGLVVTLEVDPSEAVPIYSEVSTRLRQRVQVRV
jgi:hypothetical protein